MLTCYRVRRRIDAYFDGALGERESAVAAAHVATCTRCQAELDGLRRLSAMLRRGAPSPALPEWTGFWEGVRRGIEAPRVETAPARWSWRVRPRFAAAGAAAALAAAVFMLVWQVPRTPLTPSGDPAVSVSSADTERPNATVMVYTPPEKDLAVVWLFD
jgi:anti-sigma factor RsiW